MKRPPGTPPELPGFSFIRRLGSGGFSDVYLYQQERPRRKVAVKVLVVEELTDAARAAFDAEADTMAELSAHSNIVAIYQADVAADGRPYFVMEYYGGSTLAETYKREPMSVVDTLRAGVRLSGAIATAHAKGILHRDIKPGNVLTNDYGALGLTDFGISSRVETEVSTHTTTSWPLSGSGSTTGTESFGLSIPWSPPEMFDDEPVPDVRSDVFSLAATLYTLLAGRTPFELPGGSNHENDLVGRILRGAITPLDRTDVPASLVAVLRKGMAVERAHRFDNAIQFGRALQRVEIELGYAETPLEVPNLAVAATASPEGDAGDKTRARGITSIPAQAPPPPRPVIAPPVEPPVPAASVPAPPSTTSVVADRTVMRSTGTAALDSTVMRPTALPDEPPAAAPPRRIRGRILAVVGGVIAAGLVAVAVAVGVSVAGDATASSGDDPVDSTGTPIEIEQAIPTPELVAASATSDGTVVTVRWLNPAPAEGDGYVWQRTDGAAVDDEPHPTDEESVDVTGVTPGSTVCVSVWVLRSGRLSPDPLEVCVP